MSWDIGYIIVLFLSYVIGVSIGIISGVNESCTTDFYDKTSSSSLPLFDLHPHERFVTILHNNLAVSFKALLFAIFRLGIFSITYIFYNGFVFGCIIGRCLNIFQMGLVLKSTLPHSFEIFGIIIYSYVGFILSVYLFTKKMPHKRTTLLYLIFTATFIIIIAALIESYVSMS